MITKDRGDQVNGLTRLAPKPPTGRAEVERLAERAGWTLHQTKDEDGVRSLTWLSPDRGAAVSWVEEKSVKFPYLRVLGPAPGPTLNLLHDELALHDTVSLTRLITGAAGTDELLDGLYLLGIHSSGEFDPELFALFRQGLHHGDDLVRRVAMFAAAMTDWSQFVPVVESLRDSDPVPEVRDQAVMILDANRERWAAGS
jgi:hypothetical protein